MTFNERWAWAKSTARKPVVQNPQELEIIYNLIAAKNCRNMLEVGTAEGFSTYVLSGALQARAKNVCVDLCEPHTEEERNQRFAKLREEGHSVSMIAGNSQSHEVVSAVYGRALAQPFDVVFIDGDHSFNGVKADFYNYAMLARKLIVLHDVVACEGVAKFVQQAGFPFAIYAAGQATPSGVIGEKKVYGFAVIEVGHE